jgi:hypothetical protein
MKYKDEEIKEKQKKKYNTTFYIVLIIFLFAFFLLIKRHSAIEWWELIKQAINITGGPIIGAIK